MKLVDEEVSYFMKSQHLATETLSLPGYRLFIPGVETRNQLISIFVNFYLNTQMCMT